MNIDLVVIIADIIHYVLSFLISFPAVPGYLDSWSESDCAAFEKSFALCGKDFRQIRETRVSRFHLPQIPHYLSRSVFPCQQIEWSDSIYYYHNVYRHNIQCLMVNRHESVYHDISIYSIKRKYELMYTTFTVAKHNWKRIFLHASTTR